MMLMPHVHGRHLISQGIKALHCLKYTRRRIWGLSAATAFQHRARSTGQRCKLESICCRKGVCRGGSCKHPKGELSTESEVIATAGVKLVMNRAIHCAGLWTLSKRWLQAAYGVCTGDQPRANLKNNVIITFKPKTQTWHFSLQMFHEQL